MGTVTLFQPLTWVHIRSAGRSGRKEHSHSVWVPFLKNVSELYTMFWRVENCIPLTLRLLMSYTYGAPSKARNANVVYIWTYVWQR